MRKVLMRKVLIDHLPRSTLEWLSLPVLADPFWERLPWLRNALVETQQARQFRAAQARSCARKFDL